MPSSTEPVSPESTSPGVVLVPQMEQGHDTFTAVETTAPMFPLSSTGRAWTVALGLPWTIQLYDQFVVPAAVCQVVPASVDTSTPETTPPPPSDAVPDTVTRAPSWRLAPADGLPIVADGG